MLINSNGQSFGLLSGGCLEGDLRRRAKQVLVTGKPQFATYDSGDESDFFYQLGCGGIIQIYLAPLSKDNHYLTLDQAYRACQLGENFEIKIEDQGKIVTQFTIAPAKSLLIFGGGIDAIPLIHIASILGWQISICEPRSNFASPKDFSLADTIYREPDFDIEVDKIKNADAVIIMSHSLSLDAKALALAMKIKPSYIALLGPEHRKRDVFARAQIDYRDYGDRVSGPAGFDIGGDLPESIALSILAECHQKLFKYSR